MKYLKTNKGLEFIIDNEDFERVSKYYWHWTGRYIGATINKKTVKLSRFIMNPDKLKHVDHLNGNTLDNRKCNLRICSHSENMWNTKISRKNISGYKGVGIMSNGKFRVRIGSNGKRKHIGVFDNLSDAIECRKSIAKKEHGEFYKEG